MPYADQIMGIYKIVNIVNGHAYVGQSQNIKKRIAEHFRLLRAGKHINANLQNSFNKYGEKNFTWELEVICNEANDLDMIEEAFLSGDAWFDEPLIFNIASFSKAPMRGKAHTEETRRKMSMAQKRNALRMKTPEYRKRLSEGQLRRVMNDPKLSYKVLFVLNNPHLSYAERARVVGSDASTVRKLFIKYMPIKEKFEKEHPQWRQLILPGQ